jgi:predicted nucleotidyltransferase
MNKLESYREHRDTLLTDISEMLSRDERFVAGWLTGSFSRDDADSVSDIDLSLVIADAYTTNLCTRLDQVNAQTSPERYLLFSQFGSPALIHENNNNAPEGATFTFVLYSESALMVDWILIPHSKATRPHKSKLLFDKVGIPVSPPLKPEDLEQSRKSVTEAWAFLWMMTAITIKYLIRDDSVFVTQWIENLHKLIQETERRINNEPWKYTRGSLSQLQTTREKQIELIRKLCERMQELEPKASAFINSQLTTPILEIETLLSLANK